MFFWRFSEKSFLFRDFPKRFFLVNFLYLIDFYTKRLAEYVMVSFFSIRRG